jgi:zinc transporter ZupT
MSITQLAIVALAAALAAALGPFLLRRSGAPSERLLGVANALAAGMMLGIGYPLMGVALARSALGAVLGAAAGVLVTYLAHVRLGVGVDDPHAHDHVVAAAAVHAMPEGIALGAAAALDARLAGVLAATLAVHNVSESAVLTPRLRGGAGRLRAATLATVANAPQLVLAVVALLLALRFPAMLAPLLGVAFGALMYLCLAELLPDSYRLTGRTSIALVVIVAAGVVALAGGSAS